MPCTRPSRKHVRVRHFLLFSSLNPRCSAGSLGTGVWGVPASSVSDEDTWDSDVRSLVLSSSPCAVTQCCPLSLPPDLASSAQHLPGAGVHFGISHMAHGGRGRRELPLSTASPGAAFPAEEPPWCCSPASGSLPESTARSSRSSRWPARASPPPPGPRALPRRPPPPPLPWSGLRPPPASAGQPGSRRPAPLQVHSSIYTPAA
ncbi:splicing factor 3B subunit 4-like isoform X2 [Mustela putorius furo]|uniref:Splicing factor 3B subunit 4-like isoform X2 n=1 Tax=Mustela putorius furo TaxID=9669 RepID=A0A8U0V4Z0_MUSPF|nr:splicing factor 3B subunit 4-like isoform X2 [Mustela putorius furo]